jgi:nucleoside 2-deoxyribosyltransferase
MRVYLAGYIHGEVIEQCVAWRKKIRKFYENYKGQKYPIEWLDPLNGKDLESISADGLTSSCSPNVIIHRDYQSVIRSDLIVVNMNTFGKDRPLTGTVAELAWAWEHHIPIIMITTEKKYKEHPFIKAFVSDFVDSVEDLLDKKLINLFYKGWNNAEY